MNSIIQKIQNFIKEKKKDLNQFEILKLILSEHLISKNKKMKDLNITEFIQYIDEIRDYIYLYNLNNQFQKKYVHRELLEEIENFLFEQKSLSF